MTMYSKQYVQRLEGKQVNSERILLDSRIHNQRARLRWWEQLFHQHVHAALLHTPLGFRWKELALRLAAENRELRKRLGEPVEHAWRKDAA